MRSVLLLTQMLLTLPECLEGSTQPADVASLSAEHVHPFNLLVQLGIVLVERELASGLFATQISWRDAPPGCVRQLLAAINNILLARESQG